MGLINYLEMIPAMVDPLLQEIKKSGQQEQDLLWVEYVAGEMMGEYASPRKSPRKSLPNSPLLRRMSNSFRLDPTEKRESPIEDKRNSIALAPGSPSFLGRQISAPSAQLFGGERLSRKLDTDLVRSQSTTLPGRENNMRVPATAHGGFVPGFHYKSVRLAGTQANDEDSDSDDESFEMEDEEEEQGEESQDGLMNRDEVKRRSQKLVRAAKRQERENGGSPGGPGAVSPKAKGR